MPAGECTAENSVITHAASGRTDDLRQGGRRRRRKLHAAEDVALKDPKDWTIAGKPLPRLDTADKTQRQAGLRHRPEAAGHAERRDQGLPGLRRQGEELRRRRGRGHARREEGRAGRRQRRRGGRRDLVAGQDRARCAADRLGRGAERAGLQRDHRRDAEGRARRRRRPSSATRRATRKAALADGGEEGRGGLRLSRTRTTPPWSR